MSKAAMTALASPEPRYLVELRHRPGRFLVGIAPDGVHCTYGDRAQARVMTLDEIGRELLSEAYARVYFIELQGDVGVRVELRPPQVDWAPVDWAAIAKKRAGAPLELTITVTRTRKKNSTISVPRLAALRIIHDAKVACTSAHVARGLWPEAWQRSSKQGVRGQWLPGRAARMLYAMAKDDLVAASYGTADRMGNVRWSLKPAGIQALFPNADGASR